VNFTLAAGLLASAVALGWAAFGGAGSGALLNLHGIGIVLGGLVLASLTNYPISQAVRVGRRIVELVLPSALPTPAQVTTEVVRLSRKAKAEGGLLSLQGEGAGFAGGFLEKALTVAIAAAESVETRRILETEIRQLRITRQEDGNYLRTMGTLAPMFGLLGTLLGMIEVLSRLSDPSKVGPAMALALSSAFLGIALANIVCVPLAGHMRVAAMEETLVLEMILEGVLDLAASKPPYLVEMHLSAYSRRFDEASVSARVAPEPAA